MRRSTIVTLAIVALIGAVALAQTSYHKTTDELRELADVEHNPMITLGVADAESDRAAAQALQEIAQTQAATVAALHDLADAVRALNGLSAPPAEPLVDVSAERLAAEVKYVGPALADAILAKFRVVERTD